MMRRNPYGAQSRPFQHAALAIPSYLTVSVSRFSTTFRSAPVQEARPYPDVAGAETLWSTALTVSISAPGTTRRRKLSTSQSPRRSRGARIWTGGSWRERCSENSTAPTSLSNRSRDPHPLSWAGAVLRTSGEMRFAVKVWPVPQPGPHSDVKHGTASGVPEQDVKDGKFVPLQDFLNAGLNPACLMS